MRRKKGHAKSMRSLTRGASFESILEPQLRSAFTKVSRQIRLTGLSGNLYKIDFVVNDNFVEDYVDKKGKMKYRVRDVGTEFEGYLVEASASRHAQQKMYFTLCKFMDLERAYPKLKLVIVMSTLPLPEKRNKPVYRQMDAFGYKMFHPQRDSEALKAFVLAPPPLPLRIYNDIPRVVTNPNLLTETELESLGGRE